MNYCVFMRGWRSQCDYRGRNSSNLKQHQKRHRVITDFSCPTCGFVAADLEGIREHMLSHKVKADEDGALPDMPAAKQFKCKFCEKTCNDRSNMRVHERTHIPGGGGKPFKCPHCDYRSSQRVHMVLHAKRRHGEEAAAALPSPSVLRQTPLPLPAPIVLPAHDDDMVDYDAVARAEAAIGGALLVALPGMTANGGYSGYAPAAPQFFSPPQQAVLPSTMTSVV